MQTEDQFLLQDCWQQREQLERKLRVQRRATPVTEALLVVLLVEGLSLFLVLLMVALGRMAGSL